jgi:DNA-binding NtrC family response regulator
MQEKETTRRMEVLTIDGQTRDCRSLRSILIHTNWRVHWVADLFEAMLFLHDRPVPVMVCPENLPDGSWSEVLCDVRQFPHAPKVLVYSGHSGQGLGLDILNAGAFDLLSAPLQRDEVLRAISLASRAWHDEARGREQCAAAMSA